MLNLLEIIKWGCKPPMELLITLIFVATVVFSMFMLGAFNDVIKRQREIRESRNHLKEQDDEDN